MLCVSLKHGLSANQSSYLFRRGLREFGRKRNFFVIFVGQKRHSLLSLKNKVQISNPSCTRIRRWRFKKYRLINMGIEIYKGKICTRTKYPHLNSASWESKVFPRFWMLIAEGNRRDTFFSRCLFADVISVHSGSMKRARARVIPWISKRRYIYIYIYINKYIWTLFSFVIKQLFVPLLEWNMRFFSSLSSRLIRCLRRTLKLCQCGFVPVLWARSPTCLFPL